MKNSSNEQGLCERERALIDAARREVEGKSSVDDSDVTLEAPGGHNPRFIGPLADSFAGYEILGEFHRGGQGVVYLAFQKSTQRKVAIKVMKEGPLAGSVDKARFEREVHVLGQLKHPNIVTVYDSGSAAGHFYFVMDYISGQPLDAYMTGAEHSVDKTLKLFAKICDAVNSAHLRGVIHRDLKPGNICIDADGEPHILDFGLAKVALPTGLETDPSEEEADPQVMTMTGVALGLVAALFLTQMIEQMLFGVGSRDPVTIISVVGILVGIALVATYLPARRATRLNPVEALRQE